MSLPLTLSTPGIIFPTFKKIYSRFRDELPTVDIVSVPVYIEDGSNKYCNIPEKQYGELFHPLPLHGPNVESKNCYNPEMEKQPGQLVMAGPKFVGVDDQCKYTPAIKKADTEGMIVMSGPCARQIVHSSLYNESPARAPSEGTRLMTGPIFPGIVHSLSVDVLNVKKLLSRFLIQKSLCIL